MKATKLLSAFLAVTLLTGAFCSCGSEDRDADTAVTTAPATAGITDPADSGTEGDEKVPYEDKGIFLNIDINSVTFPYLSAMALKDTLSPEDIYPFVDQYAGTQVTDLAFDVFCQFSASPSDVWTDIVDIYNRKEENGYSVDYTLDVGMYNTMYTDFGINPFTVWFGRCRDKGITPWLSIRMNDCHCPDETTVWLRGNEFYEGSEKGWKLGSAYGYQRHCFNYANEEFRARMLAYITEQIMMYDVDGLELDFSREMTCLDYLNDKNCSAVMTAFLRDVNAAVKEAEKKWGHDIRIKINLIRDIAQNKVFGFDTDAIAAEGLADIFGIGPRWASNDSNIPVKEWKEKYPTVEIVPTITDLTFNLTTNYMMVAGYAASFLAQGADKIGLYNFFSNPLDPSDTYTKIYRNCGSLATLETSGRRNIITYQDIAPIGETAWKPLPAKANGFTVAVGTGPVPADKPVNVIVGVDRKLSEGDLKLFVNDKEADFKSMTKYAAYYDHSEKEYRFIVPAELCTGDATQILRFETEIADLVISYVEMTVCANIG